MSEVTITPLDELAVDEIAAIDEKISGEYRPDVWETRTMYYIRRDPEGSYVAREGDQIVGFMMGEVRAGEFGMEEPTGWIEVLGVDPDHRGKKIGQQLFEAMIARFEERGATSVRTLVDGSMGSLQGFFQRLGFEEAALKPLVYRLNDGGGE